MSGAGTTGFVVGGATGVGVGVPGAGAGVGESGPITMGTADGIGFGFFSVPFAVAKAGAAGVGVVGSDDSAVGAGTGGSNGWARLPSARKSARYFMAATISRS